MEHGESWGDIRELKVLIPQFISSMAGQNGCPRWVDVKTSYITGGAGANGILTVRVSITLSARSG